MSRLFTFGCSYTNWPWPTWADIVAHELKLPHENWALPGLGNVGIASRILECDLTNKFTDSDVILVVWSSWTREDRFNVKKSFSGNGWNRLGDVHHTYDKDFVQNYWSLSNDLVKNSTSIIQSNRLFDIKFNGHIQTLLVNGYQYSNLGFDENETNIAKFYEPHIPNDGIYDNTVHKCKYTSLNENHPDVLSHLNYTLEYIMPKLGLTMTTDTISHFTKMDQDIENFTRITQCHDRKTFNNSLSLYLLEHYDWEYSPYYGIN